VGEVFSDPPMNLFDIEVLSGGRARLTDDVTFPLTGHLSALSPGKYRLGIRASHVRLAPASEADQMLPSTVLLEEITGSETLLYASSGPISITAQIPGVHRHSLGAPVDLFLATNRLFAFTLEGKLAAAPSLKAPQGSRWPELSSAG
jgi:glycerol transport system ATP-binding protein